MDTKPGEGLSIEMNIGAERLYRTNNLIVFMHNKGFWSQRVIRKTEIEIISRSHATVLAEAQAGQVYGLLKAAFSQFPDRESAFCSSHLLVLLRLFIQNFKLCIGQF